MTTFILFTAATSGLVSNTHYPNQATITDATGLEAAACFDHVAAEYQGGQRSTHGFVTSNCLVMDIDNDYTENPEDWVTPQHLADLLTDVELMTATSRNHNTSKHGTPPRPRFHVYLPIGPVTDPATYAGLKKSLADRFTFFDAGALDAARFLYGHPALQVEVFTGSMLVVMSGSLFLSAAAFFCVQDVILSYPADLRYLFLWGTVAALFVLLLPIFCRSICAHSCCEQTADKDS